MDAALSILILAAGRGTRMKSPTPKVLFDVCGLPALLHVMRAAESLQPARLAIVVAPDAAAVRQAVAGRAECVQQDEPLGTGHAVRGALAELGITSGDLMVLCADGPLFRADSLSRLLAAHRAAGAAETLLTARVSNPAGLGRVVASAAGAVERIVEELDADAATRALCEVNTGIGVFQLERAAPVIAALDNRNAKGEYYLTDVVAGLCQRGAAVRRVLLDDAGECAMFNSIEELAEVRRRMRERICRFHMANGVDVVDPAATWIDVDVEIGAGTTVLPGSVIGRGVRIGRGCVIGPFAHLRGAAVLEDGAEIGNFVEVKKSRIGAGAKAKHLTYLGDATVGKKANIGCGTITANYDGVHKHATAIGDGAFIGSGTVLIAPAEVGARGVTGAGAVVTRNTRIPEGGVYVGVPARPIAKGAVGAERAPRDSA